MRRRDIDFVLITIRSFLMKNDTILICNISGFFRKKTHIDIEKVRLTDNTLILIETRSFIIFNYFTNEK